MAAYFSRTYLARRWLSRYLSASDAFAIALTLLAGYLASLSYSTNPTATTWAAALYAMAAIARFVIVLRTRRARDHIQATVFWNLCHQIDTSVLDTAQQVRITLFERDRLRWGHIVPKYRFAPSASDPIEEADHSRARYRKGEGVTGRAWKEPGQIFLANFPEFATHEEFIAFYVNRVGISREVALELSPHMQETQGILSYGMKDTDGRFLGVISMDFETPIQTVLSPSDGTRQTGIPLDGERIHDVLQSMQTVLAAFRSRPGTAS